MATCIFCNSEIEGNYCPNCGFSQEGGEHLPGTLRFGSSLRDYILGDIISVDGESTSYLAYDRLNKNKVIVKEFLPVSMIGPRTNDIVGIQTGKEVLYKNLMMDFEDLYRTIKGMDDPLAQKVYEVFQANGTVYAVLENIKGENLRQNLVSRGKTYSFRDARWLFQPLFNLIARLEDINLSHGGISDENLIVDLDGNLRLTGFAIQDLRVKNDHIMFKLYEGFSAPEQYSQSSFSGLYTDIYSVAATLFFAVTGKKIRDGIFEEDKRAAAMFPEHAVNALKRATEKDPSKRISKISDFVALLDNKAIAPQDTTKEIRKPAVRITEPGNADLLKKYLPLIIRIPTIILFAVAVISFSKGGEDPSSFEEETSLIDGEKRIVPYLIGKTYEEIMRGEEGAAFRYEITEDYSNDYPKGQIMYQAPRADTMISEDTLIYITISKGPHFVTVPVGMVGMNIDSVREMLNEMGVDYEVEYVKQTETYKFGTVTGTDKQPGTTFDAGKEKLIIYVSDNTPLPATPTSVPQSSSSETPQVSSEPEQPISSEPEQPSSSSAPERPSSEEQSSEEQDDQGE